MLTQKYNKKIRSKLDNIYKILYVRILKICLLSAMFQINVLDPSGYGSILIDNMSPIIPQCQLLTLDNLGHSCQGNDGFIETSIIENGTATPPFSYAWSNGQNTPDIYNLSPGTYDLVVTDSDGDCVSTLSQEINGIELNGLSINPSCEQTNDGSISIDLSGGGAPYQYLWSNGATTQNLSNIVAGTYSLTVIDANNCQADEEFTLVAEPTNIIATPDECSENFSVSVNSPNSTFEQKSV